MAQHAGGAFPASGVSTGDTFFQTTTGLEYRYLGGDSTDPLNWVIIGGTINGDPDTTGWGTKQLGARWFDTSLNGFRGWNGSAIIYIG